MSSTNTRKNGITAAVLTAFLVAATPLTSQATTLESLTEKGTVRVGYASEAPFAFATPDGVVTGESPEIAKAIFKRLGVKEATGVLTEWGALIPGLTAKRFDVIAAGMYITPARCKQVIFSDPLSKITDTFLVAPGNPKNLRSYADVAKNPDAKLAMLAGSVYTKYARDAGINDDQILQVPDATAQLQAILAGRADAAVSTRLTIKGIAAKGGDKVEAVQDFQDSPDHINYGALAFRPDDTALRDAVNAELKKWLGSEEHRKTVSQFGFDETNIPDKTAAEVCGRT
ncbi:ectoine/hydroxyectoine ABC transporter substrate-binding protein EhuB [Pseudomonas sp. NPDC090592]|uniref:ectoine/hydroxyectoine ABC transporter substrate-binding protein EhuB n=1 Tax=Pseudomonas sp. NPDC090592 TaxID=3364480 RepID=UPI00383BF5F6